MAEVIALKEAQKVLDGYQKRNAQIEMAKPDNVKSKESTFKMVLTIALIGGAIFLIYKAVKAVKESPIFNIGDSLASAGDTVLDWIGDIGDSDEDVLEGLSDGLSTVSSFVSGGYIIDIVQAGSDALIDAFAEKDLNEVYAYADTDGINTPLDDYIIHTDITVSGGNPIQLL